MAYTSLYRNFRPIRFSDMVGQDHITRTLRNQIMSDRVGHAYLFTGGRGTGKTTSAKILARVVNCLNPKDGEPCNECEICKEILDGSLTDVVEMDAASNNGVDDVRAIREEVNFLPTKAKYRVYIIDEVHMLSTGAFNALLKTLEEPPSHVKFILATTEPQKLPMTILSRCQRFDFKQIPKEDIIKRLKIICDEMKIKVDEDALDLMSVLSEGHMRDAISILERCSQENEENITIESVKELVGIPKIEYINQICNSIIEHDCVGALEVIDQILKEGKDLYNFLWEVIKYFKDILVFKATQKLDIYSGSEMQAISELASKVSQEKILDIIYSLSDLENDIKWSSQKTIMFQIGIIKICRKEELVKQISTPVTNQPNKRTDNNFNTSNQKSERLNKQDTSSTMPKNEMSMATSDINVLWKRIIQNLKASGKIRLYTTLVNTKVVEESDLIWRVIFSEITTFNKSIIGIPENIKALEAETFKATKKEIHFKFVDSKNNTGVSDKKNNNDKPANNLGIDINIID